MTKAAAIPKPVTPATAGARTAEMAFLLLLPVAAFFAIHFEPVNQNGMLDPYVYTGYVHNFADLIERYGIRYYAVRFGLILPERTAVALFGPMGGYLALRYLMALVFGVPLYAVCKRYTSGAVAVAIYTAAMTSPLVARMLLWDHPDATGGPFLSAAICLFLLGRGRTVFSLLAGLALGMAANSNVFTVAIFGIFLAVYGGLWIGHRRRLAKLIRRVAIAAGGVLAVCAAGSFYYYQTVGFWDIFSVTLETSRMLAQGGMAMWHLPGFAWTLISCQVYIPVWLGVCCAACFAYWRRSFPLAVMSCFGIAVTLFYYVHQFLMGSDTLQLFYYFSYAAPAIFLMLAVVLQRLRLSAPPRPVWFVSAAVASTSLVWVAVSFAPAGTVWAVRNRAGVFLALAAAASIVWVVVLWRKDAGSVLALAAMVAFGLASDAGCLFYTSAIHRRGDAAHGETDVYRVALQFMRRVPRLEDSGVMLFWYNNRAGNLISSVQSTYLFGYSRVSGTTADNPGMPSLNSDEVWRLKGAQTVALLGETEREVRLGLESLTSHGLAHREMGSEVLAAGDYKLYWTLVDLRPPAALQGVPR